MSSVFTTAERREIAGRARTLHERLNGPANDPGPDPPIDPDQILETWKEVFPTEDAFQARLEQVGVSEQRVREQLTATHWPADEPLPEWIGTVADLITFVETAGTTDQDTATGPDAEPFADLLAPIANYACDCLPDSVVPRTVLSPLVAGLRTRLEFLCIRALYVEFKSFVEYHDPDLAAADPDEFTDPPTTYYEQFVDAMFEQGFRNLCLEYPVLVRQLDRLITHWVDSVTEVCRRIRADRDVLEERFGVEGTITRLEPLSEDAHAGGRLPIRVSFESGSVIYKPRPVDGGIAFYEILDRLSDSLSVPSIETPTYLSRDTYGWMETIEYRDLPEFAAADRYYERAGAILCAAYVLNVTDIQLENLIVDGERPTVIDGETIFHPHVTPESKPVQSEIADPVDRSLLFTALLPWSVGDPRNLESEGLAASVAGFGQQSDQTKMTTRTRPTITAANTDVMAVDAEHVTIEQRTNTPSIDGEDYPPTAYVESILSGFEETYETIRELHADGRFLGEIVDPESVSDIENRLIFRGTVEYANILRSAAARDPLRDGARLSVEFESLTVPLVDESAETGRYWPLYAPERRALRRRDIPRFSSRPDQQAVFHDGEALAATVDTSGYDRVRARLDDLSATDRHRQCWIIEQTFDPSASDELPPATEVTDDSLQQNAAALFETANDARIETGDGIGWVSITSDHAGLNLYPADSSLYWGRSGIALTAAALADTTGQDRYRQLVDEILEPVLDAIPNDDLSAGLGGVRGIGSVIYTLSVIADLLDEDAYADLALTATQSISDEQIAADDTFDIMEGTAGTLLSLLAYHDRYGGSDVLERAIACGDRLLEGRSTVDGYQVWATTDDDVPFTGFSHGSSGIAYALARLASTTGESRYAAAAQEALAYEASLYDRSKANWPKSNQGVEYVDRWCHGRSGMALARIGIGEQLGDETLIDEATTVLSATAAADPATIDTVCCGNAGRIAALLVGSRRADVDRAAATELAGQCLARRARDGTCSLVGHSQWFVNPTFFDGVTGVAYTLLRLRDPEGLPCALLLE